MREITSIGQYLGNGSRAQVHCVMIEGERVALKIYHEKSFYKREKEAYEHLLQSKSSPCLKLPRYFGIFVLSESILSSFVFRYRQTDRRHRCGSGNPYRKALGFEQYRGVGLDTVINGLDDTRLVKFENDLCKTIRALHDVGISHRDLKADNVLVDSTVLEENPQDTIEYIVIDLSEAVLKHNSYERHWNIWAKRDLGSARGILAEARAVKALNLGFQTLSRIIPSKPDLNNDIVKQADLDVETQLELSRLLKAASLAPGVAILVEDILQKSTSLTPELCFAVTNILIKHGRSDRALAVLKNHVATPITPNNLDPQLSRQKALLLQSMGPQTYDAIQAFELAIAQFSKQCGPLDNATLCTRREYACFRATLRDYDIAMDILRDILATLAGQELHTPKQARIINRCSEDIKLFETCKASFLARSASSRQHLTSTPKKKSSDSGTELETKLRPSE